MITIKQYLRWAFRPIFKRKKQFRNEAMAVEKEKHRINLNKRIYTDTNSLMHKIETESVYADFYKKEELLDFSNY